MNRCGQICDRLKEERTPRDRCAISAVWLLLKSDHVVPVLPRLSAIKQNLTSNISIFANADEIENGKSRPECRFNNDYNEVSHPQMSR